MTHIPFPPPHDAEALNRYLDAIADGDSGLPTSHAQEAAQEFHKLAASGTKPSAVAAFPHTKGHKNMDASRLLPPPMSNRIRRAMSQPTSRKRPWLSVALVAFMLVAVVSYAWTNQSDNESDNLAYAPMGLASIAASPESTTAPGQAVLWTQPISPNECPMDEVIRIDRDVNPAGTLYTNDDYEQTSPERSYEVVGSPSSEDAIAAITRMRQFQGCFLYSRELPFSTARFE